MAGLRLVAAQGVILGVALSLMPAAAAEEPIGGRDVVPTSPALVETMLDLAGIGAGDRLVDLGSGDGRTLIAAAKRGASARGIEYNADMVALSRHNAEKAGMADKLRIDQADIFESDFSDADVVTIYLLPDLYDRLRPILLRLKPGTRIVSNTFDMGGWHPDRTATLPEECDYYFCKALLWIVPARIAGAWKIEAGALSGELMIEQTFQNFSGMLRGGDNPVPVHGRLNGNEIVFIASGVEYAGRVDGDTIRGTTRNGEAWSARLVTPAGPKQQ